MCDYVEFFSTARPHQVFDGAASLPLDSLAIDGPIRHRDILRGIIHDYYRAA